MGDGEPQMRPYQTKLYSEAALRDSPSMYAQLALLDSRHGRPSGLRVYAGARARAPLAIVQAWQRLHRLRDQLVGPPLWHRYDLDARHGNETRAFL